MDILLILSVFYLEVILSSKKREEFHINGVTVVPGDETIDISELHEVFTGKGLNATQLRSSG